jgi:hypothetical protein
MPALPTPCIHFLTFWRLGSYSCDFEGYVLLGYDAVQPDTIPLLFQRNSLSSPSALESKPSQERNLQLAELSPYYPEDGGNNFI